MNRIERARALIARLLREAEAAKSPAETHVLTIVDRQVDPKLYGAQPYIARIIEAAQTAPPGLSHAHIFHDDWCGIFQGRVCDCDPAVVLRPENETH